MRKSFLALSCVVVLFATGCLLDEVTDFAGYIPIAEACDHCDWPIDLGDVVDDIIDDILDGKRLRAE